MIFYAAPALFIADLIGSVFTFPWTNAQARQRLPVLAVHALPGSAGTEWRGGCRPIDWAATNGASLTSVIAGSCPLASSATSAQADAGKGRHILFVLTGISQYEIMWGMILVADIREKPAPAASPGRDPRIVVAEVWLCMLGGLAEIGVRFASFLAHDFAPSRGGPDGPMLPFRLVGDPVTAFERVARAVRLAVALAFRIETEIAASTGGKPVDPDAFVSPAPRSKAKRMAGLSEAVRGAKDLGDKDRGTAPGDICGDVETPERAEGLAGERDEGLGEDDEFYRLLAGPLKDAVAAICADLGLKPDWSLWTEDGFPPPPGGAEEDWIAFFLRERDMAPAPGSDGLRPTPPPPPDRHPPSPPRCLAAPRPPDRAGRLEEPRSRTRRASLMSSTIDAGAPWVAELRHGVGSFSFR
jgi:hypothetical protein